MKKRFWLVLLTALSLLAVLTVCYACGTSKQSDSGTTIEIAEAPSEPYYVGDPNIVFSDVILAVKYADGTVKKVALDDTMISGEDKLKFTRVGTHTVTVTYDGGTGFYQFDVRQIKEKNVYLASFYSLGGTEVRSVAASTLNAFGIPEREGYTFDGWYTEIEYAGSRMTYLGERAVEPYVLTKNTAFYAKWLDNRVCTVTFYDWNDAVIYREEIHYGERLNLDAYAYPEKNVTAGRTFLNWTVINGSAEEVTENLIIRSNFEIDNCIVKLLRSKSAESREEIIEVIDTKKYGETIFVDDTLRPLREGTTSRYVQYFDRDEENEETADRYIEIPEDGVIELTSPYTTIMPIFTPLTYDVVIYNGIEEGRADEDTGTVLQKDEYLKNGTIAVERVYENEAALKNFIVQWDQSFDFSEYKQDPYLATPTKITGYKSEWCYVVEQKDGSQVYRNALGRIWDPDAQVFRDPVYAEGESASEWTLRDADDNYVAVVYQGVLTHIKGNVTVAPLYTKELYTVRLMRYAANGTSTELATFRVKYRTDFDLYDNDTYPHAPDAVAEYPAHDVVSYSITDAGLREKAISSVTYDPQVCDVEKLYLKENTDLAVKALAHRGGYYGTNEEEAVSISEEDWAVTWYSSATLTTDDVKLPFGTLIPVRDESGRETGQVRFTYEITGNTTLYCRDTDRRKYWVYFSYTYDFERGEYRNAAVTPDADRELYEENEVIQPPIQTEQISCVVNGVTVSYVFLGWYDVPFGMYLLTGERGNKLTNFSTRTTSVHYYAHYECPTKFTVKIYDKTQSTAFVGKTGYEACAVADNSISYEMPIASRFDMSMIFKGTSDGSGTTISGQRYYDRSKQNAFYDDYYLDGSGVAAYLRGFYATDTSAKLDAILAVFRALRDDFNAVLTQVYAHTYDYAVNEYGFYLTGFNYGGWNGDGNTTVTDFGTLVTYLTNAGCAGNVIRVMNEAGYDAGTFGAFGTWNDWIRTYGERLAELYELGYEDKHTGFTGISHANSATISDEVLDRYSLYQKIVLLIGVLEEYREFLDEYEAYAYQTVSPQYADSAMDLNHAYDYNGLDEIKYSFSGWYTTPTYTVSYSPSFHLDFIVNEDYNLYAKWLDITKGTEGLVYEEVTFRGGNAYVLVDFVNKRQYDGKGYAASGYYYVTTDDTGTVPAEVVTTEQVELQLPSSIDKYVDYTAQARNEADWSTAYRDYLVRSGDAYVQARSTFDDNETYYQVETYPVIGIKGDALTTYASKIFMVTLPLNLYFIQEGAFKLCPVVLYSRMKAKEGEVALSYVVTTDSGYAVYQQDACTDAVVGKASGDLYATGRPNANTLVAFAVGNELVTEYRLGSDLNDEGALIPNKFTTEYIGAYAFYQGTYITDVTDGGSVVEVHDSAFSGMSNLEYFGAATAYDPASAQNGALALAKGVRSIGVNAFYQCVKIRSVSVENLSELTYVGRDALKETTWHEGDKHKGVITLAVQTAGGTDATFVLGYAPISGYNMDVGKAYTIDGTESASGAYMGISTETTRILLGNGGGTVENVILYGNVLLITENAFDGLNAHRITWYGVRTVGARAFANCPELSDVYVNGAYNGEACTLGNNVFYGKGEDSVALHFDSVATENTVKDDSWTAYDAIFQ